jgi:hypothetical protein
MIDDDNDEERIVEEEEVEEVVEDEIEEETEDEDEENEEDANEHQDNEDDYNSDDFLDGEDYTSASNPEEWNDKRTRKLCARVRKDDPSLTLVGTHYFQGLDFASQLGPAMIGNTKLREFGLMFTELSEQEATFLAKGIAQSKLKKIDIWCDFVRSASARKILYQGISQSTTIQEISLTDVKVEVLDGLGDVVLALKQLEQLKIEEVCRFSDQRLFQLVSNAFMSNITSLKLEGVELGDFTMAAQGFGNNVTLKTLELDNCELDDCHIQLLVERWHPKSQLKRLLLDRNNVGPEGMQLVFRAAAEHLSLHELSLRRNPGIGLKGLKLFGEQLSTQLHLKDVNIDYCAEVISYDDENSPEAQLQAEAIQQARCALMNGMKQNQSITQLRLDVPFNSLQVSFYTELNQFGRGSLLSTDQQLAPTIWCHALAKCQQQPNYATSFLYYFLCEQPTLVQCTRKRRRSIVD